MSSLCTKNNCSRSKRSNSVLEVQFLLIVFNERCSIPSSEGMVESSHSSDKRATPENL